MSCRLLGCGAARRGVVGETAATEAHVFYVPLRAGVVVAARGGRGAYLGILRLAWGMV